MNKERDLNNMFKNNKNNGEHRNGRLSQFKNSKSGRVVHSAENEYVSKKEEE